MVSLRFLLRWCTALVLITCWAGDIRAQAADNVAEPRVLLAYDRTESATASQTAESAAAMSEPASDIQSALNEPDLNQPLAPLPKPSASGSVLRSDPAIVLTSQSTAVQDQELEQNSRKLAPLARKNHPDGGFAGSASRAGKLPFEIPNISSLGTAGTGLVLVVGLFLVCASLIRRGGPNPMSLLPSDAVAVLGRIPLAPKKYAHLLQVGNKLVLVSITADRTDTITEVTEPAEVDRLLTLCTKGNKQSSSVEFQRLLQQMAKEPARGFLGKQAASPFAGSVRG